MCTDCCQCCNKVGECGIRMRGDWLLDRGVVAASLNSFATVPYTYQTNRKNCGFLIERSCHNSRLSGIIYNTVIVRYYSFNIRIILSRFLFALNRRKVSCRTKTHFNTGRTGCIGVAWWEGARGANAPSQCFSS